MGRRKFKKAVAGTVAGRRRVDAKENATKKSAAKYGIDELLDKAQGCIDRFEYEVAQKFCQRVLELDPDNVRALETTGTLLMELGNLDGAKQCFGRSVEVAPDSGHEKYMYLGQLFDGAQAVQCFQKGIELMEKELAEREAKEISAACAAGDDRTVSHSDVSRAYCSIAEIYMTDCCFEGDAEEKCRVSVEKAITADGENPEAFQLMASFLLSKDEKQSAKENMQKSVSLWLPKFRSLQSGDDTGEQFDPTQVCPLTFETRLAGARILIELEDYETGSEVLESLLDENDEDTEVWYLLGWLNHLHGQEYWGNARHYLTKAAQMFKKTKCQDEPMLKHIEELLTELGPGDAAEEEGDEAEDMDDDDDDDDWETDSETEGDDKAAGDMEH